MSEFTVLMEMWVLVNTIVWLQRTPSSGGEGSHDTAEA